jgi:hypothetical protein
MALAHGLLVITEHGNLPIRFVVGYHLLGFCGILI